GQDDPGRRESQGLCGGPWRRGAGQTGWRLSISQPSPLRTSVARIRDRSSRGAVSWVLVTVCATNTRTTARSGVPSTRPAAVACAELIALYFSASGFTPLAVVDRYCFLKRG